MEAMNIRGWMCRTSGNETESSNKKATEHISMYNEDDTSHDNEKFLDEET